MDGHEAYPDTHHDIASSTLFGFWIYLMTDFILFATLFASYAVLRNNTYGGPSAQTLFSPTFALIETITLLLSSFARALAMLALSRQEKTKTLLWYSVTFLLGSLFLALVLSEFSRLVSEGNSWEKSAFLSAYFTLIGTHALHIALGLLFMVVFMVHLYARGFTDVVIRRLTCFKLFWFFSYVVWIFMFSIVYLMGVS